MRFILQNILVLGMFVGVSSHALCQSLQWGEESNVGALDEIIHINDDGFYTLNTYDKGKRKVVVLRSFTNEFTVKKEQEVLMKYDKKNVDFYKLYTLGGQLYITGILHDSWKNKIYFLIKKINLITLESDEGWKVLIENEISGQKEFFRRFSTQLYVKTSLKKKYLVLAYVYGGKKKEYGVSTIKVFDENINEVWRTDHRSSYMKKELSIKNVRVDDHANVYIIGKKIHEYYHKEILAYNYYDDPKKEVKPKDKDNPLVEYKVMVYKQKGHSFKEYTVTLKEKFIKSFDIFVQNQRLVCAGFYSHYNNRGIRGIYLISIDDKNKAILNTKTYAFKDDVLDKHLSKQRKEEQQQGVLKDANKGLYEYYIDQFLLKEDGGLTLIAEQNFSRLNNVILGNNIDDNTKYYSNRILIMDINADHEVNWVSFVKKWQKSEGRSPYLSYANTWDNEYLHFLYNSWTDDENRIKHAKVNREGEVTTSILFSQKKGKKVPYFEPSKTERDGKGGLIIYSQKGRFGRYRFGKVSF